MVFRWKSQIHHNNGRGVWFTLSGLGKFILSKTNSWPLQISGWRMTFPFGARRASPDVPSSSGILVEKQPHKLASFFLPKSQLPSHHNKFVLPGLQAKAGLKIQVQVHSLTPTSPIATSSMALTWHSWELRYFSSDHFVKTGVFSHSLLRSCLYMFITFSSEHHQMLSTQSPLNKCFFYHCFFQSWAVSLLSVCNYIYHRLGEVVSSMMMIHEQLSRTCASTLDKSFIRTVRPLDHPNIWCTTSSQLNSQK